jgi:uncharacterized protein (TIGR02453 family)
MNRVRHFSPSLFEFLTELKENNTREWFHDHKDLYIAVVQEPLLRFISDFADRLHAISPNFVADPRPSGGSMFRIYRDVRFSKDKSPYKTHAAAQFRHRVGRDVHAPGFYLHLEPGNVFVGAGIWHPDRETLTGIRDAIVDDPSRWSSLVTDPGFTEHHRLGGESLKRPPRGYDPEHELIDDLKRKDFTCFEEFTQAAACKPGFIDRIDASYLAAGPFVQFLTEAVGEEF